MSDRVKNIPAFAKQDTGASCHPEAQDGGAATASTDEGTSSWHSPAFAEFDLCMEVTVYAQQWEQF